MIRQVCFRISSKAVEPSVMGRKRFRIGSDLQPNKRAKGFIGDDDRISRLPDEILVDILSSLSLKEAARTSVLSFRWINLWKQTQSLNFDAESALDMIGSCRNLHLRGKLLAGERSKYTNWVNRILRSHKAVILKEFVICFDFSSSAKKTINKWVAYAFARRVERLEIDLTSAYPYTRALNCAFPQELLTQSNPVVEFKSLKALLLKRVNVTGEQIEFFLRNFPLLEELVVHYAEGLSIVKVCGSSLKLKHLEIWHCHGVRSIKVSAPNLVSLGLMVPSEILLEHVPRLAHVTVFIIGASETCVNRLTPTFSCCISQLETLTLQLCWLKHIERCEFPKMNKLKRLVIECKLSDSLLGLTSWIRESPHLEEFVLKSGRCTTETHDFVYGEVENNIWPPHHHLKVVEFFGFCGRGNDVELVRYFFRNCLVLEKVIINCHYRPLHHLDRLRALPSDLAEEQIARNRAQQLEPEVPHGVELVIL